MQLTAPRRSGLAVPAVLAGLVLAAVLRPGRARADQMPQNASGEVSFRGNYWRDRNTRVVNPTADVHRDLPSGVNVGAHYVLDAITSASVAAGAMTDQPFTELRHEAGFDATVPLSRKVSVAGHYSYSSESDYWSHDAGLRLRASLLQDNTVLLLGADYGHNAVGKRLGPTGYSSPPPNLSLHCMMSAHAGDALCAGVMHNVHGVLLLTQLFTPRLLGTVSYELTVLDGYQNNPYRPVFVGGERTEVENLPGLRVRHVLSASAHAMAPLQSQVVPHLTFRPGFRFHTDSWGVSALDPELATYVPVGPVEFRVLFSYYRQFAADFYRSESGGRKTYYPDTPGYDKAVPFGDDLVYTSDVKLGPYSTYTTELSLKWRMSALRRVPHLGDLLYRSLIEVSAGLWLADRADGWQFGIPLQGGDPQAPAGCSIVCGAYYGSLALYVPL